MQDLEQDPMYDQLREQLLNYSIPLNGALLACEYEEGIETKSRRAKSIGKAYQLRGLETRVERLTVVV